MMSDLIYVLLTLKRTGYFARAMRHVAYAAFFVVVTAAFLSSHAHAAEYLSLNCYATLPNSDPLSCVAQNIPPEEVEVEIKSGAVTDWVRLGQEKIVGGTMVHFRQQGDMGCIYKVYIGEHPLARHEDFVKKYDDPRQPDTDIGKKFTHCVQLPNPDLFDDRTNWPKFARYISDACLHGCTEIDGEPTCATYKAMTADPEYRAFFPPTFSLGIQCIEETMLRVFDAHSETGAFQRMSDFLQPIVAALMALSIIFTGLRYAGVFFDPTKPGMKQSDFIWMFLKLILVAVFSVGSNMAFFFDATRIAQAAIISTVIDLQEGVVRMADYSLLYDSNTFAPEGVSDEAEEFDGIAFDPDDYDYDFCAMDEGFDYSDVGYTDVDGNPMPNTGMLLRYWDMLDCRFAQYMGVGWFSMDSSGRELNVNLEGEGGVIDTESTEQAHSTRAVQAPINILFSLYLFLVPGIGWVIAALAIVYISFLFAVFAKMFMTYISYLVGLCLLFLFAPLFVAASLFEATKGMFSTWRNYLIHTALHPVFFFLFLIIFLMITDRLYFGGNHEFNGFGNTDPCASVGKKGQLSDPNKITLKEVNEECVCEDSSVLPCIYGTKAGVKRHNQYIGILTLNFYVLDIIGMDMGSLVKAFGKLFVLFLVAFYILQYVETMARAITSGVDFMGNAVQVKNPLAVGVKYMNKAITVGVVGLGAALAVPTLLVGATGILGSAMARSSSRILSNVTKSVGRSVTRAMRRAVSALKPTRAAKGLNKLAGRNAKRQSSSDNDDRSAYWSSGSGDSSETPSSTSTTTDYNNPGGGGGRSGR